MARSDIFRKLFRLGTVAVLGDSMSPAYKEGDWLLVRWRTPYDVHDVVVIEREIRPGIFIIKRIKTIESGKFWVEGDNPSSTDSRQWGSIDQSEIVGKVLFRVRRGKVH
jgi:nickel-type superoxide dismutase maturation protease